MSQPLQANEPSIPPQLQNPTPQPSFVHGTPEDISSHNKTDINFQPDITIQKRKYQHFIPYSSFRECVKKSGIIIPRVTEAANIALRYHESMISRPPGFGKTFIISILECLFRKEKSLFQRDSHFTAPDSNGVSQFENYQVGYETNNDRDFSNDVKDILEQWPWDDDKRLFVLRFDFSTVLVYSNDDEAIHNGINQLILRVAEYNDLRQITQIDDFLESKKNRLKNPRSGKNIQCDTLIDYFLTKIEKLNIEYVILIDDADYIMRMTEDYSNHIVLSFYHSILKHSKKYQFLFATCVFPTSIPFTDISLNSDVSTTFGFTLKDISQLEILDEFLEILKKNKEISRLTHTYFHTKADLLNEIDYLYGGYIFSPLSEYSVLNPISVIECIEKFSFNNFWIEKVLPWREDLMSNDFLNYFTIYRQTASMLFNDVIVKILKCPDKINESVRNHYIFLFNFGIFTFAENGKKAFNINTGVSFYIWKVPNILIYEFLSDLMVSFLQTKSTTCPRFLNENMAELCSAIKDSSTDNFLSSYYEKELYDFYVGAVLASAGLTISCHFEEPYFQMTAESVSQIFLINVFKSGNPNQIAAFAFKNRFNEGNKFSILTSKSIVFLVFNFEGRKVQVLLCKPNFADFNDFSNKLKVQYESHEFEIPPILPQQNKNKNNYQNQTADMLAQAQHIDKMIFKKKTTWPNTSLSHGNQYDLNSSLVTYLSQKAKNLVKCNSEPVPGVKMDEDQK